MRMIDADALLDDVFERYCKECDKREGIKNGKYRIVYNVGDAPCRACSVDDMKDDLENAPTIEERKKGKWIHDGRDFPHGVDWIHCSVCGKKGINVPADLTNFCQNCGADMRGEQDE